MTDCPISGIPEANVRKKKGMMYFAWFLFCVIMKPYVQKSDTGERPVCQ